MSARPKVYKDENALVGSPWVAYFRGTLPTFCCVATWRAALACALEGRKRG